MPAAVVWNKKVRVNTATCVGAVPFVLLDCNCCAKHLHIQPTCIPFHRSELLKLLGGGGPGEDAGGGGGGQEEESERNVRLNSWRLLYSVSKAIIDIAWAVCCEFKESYYFWLLLPRAVPRLVRAPSFRRGKMFTWTEESRYM